MINKYLKYKLKYIKLKKKIIGSGRMIISNSLFYRLVKEVKEEIFFNFVFLDNVKVAMIKSCDDYSREKLFNHSFRRINVAGHTHPISYMEMKKITCIPPSNKDYSTIIERHFKRNEKMHLVFEPSGIWAIKLKDDFITYLNNKFPIVIKLLKDYVDDDGYYTSDEFNNELKLIEKDTNELYLRLAHVVKENFLTVEEYINELDKLGFNVTFFKWNEPLVINVEINKEIENEIMQKYKLFDITKIDEDMIIIKNAKCDDHI